MSAIGRFLALVNCFTYSRCNGNGQCYIWLGSVDHYIATGFRLRGFDVTKTYQVLANVKLVQSNLFGPFRESLSIVIPNLK